MIYAKTLKLANILEKLEQETFTLEGVSQETIDAMIKRGLIVRFDI